MCNPLAIGSKQANSTIWARCRGGKPLRSSRALGIAKYSSESVLLIAATDAPDGGLVTLHLHGDGLNPMTSPERQKNAGMLDLEPRLRPAMGDVLQDSDVGCSDFERTRSSTTHCQPPS